MEKWLVESETNKQYFLHLQTIFNKAASVKDVPHFDTDAAWTKLKSKLNTNQETKIRTLKPDVFGLTWRIAASVLLVAIVGYFAYVTFWTPTAFQPLEVVAETKI